MDLEKSKRETSRWRILQVLDQARPIGANESLVLTVLRDLQPDTTQLELRRELQYLEGRKMVEVVKRDGIWIASLTRCGIDVVEYTIDVEPGIARPEKYW